MTDPNDLDRDPLDVPHGVHGAPRTHISVVADSARGAWFCEACRSWVADELPLCGVCNAERPKVEDEH